ncbi:hypothetical protein GCM10009430_32400 [Aquimarina litoralis]|uniref:Lipoprotein n=1 Tax=Aquimarina litoralis TaxID=584605 RepID=A0ABP3UBC1_9FLAO
MKLFKFTQFVILLLTITLFTSNCTKDEIDSTELNSSKASSLIKKISGELKFLTKAPRSVELNELVSDDHLFVFLEKTNHRLTKDLKLDLSKPGDYFPDSVPDNLQNWKTLNPGIVKKGTKVHSVYFHYDNETYNQSLNVQDYFNCKGQYQVNGKITFNRPILGIIMRASGGKKNNSLINSDKEVGLPRVDYCEHNFRHFPGINVADGCKSDRFVLSQDRRTLTVKNNTDVHHDNYRVILLAE